MAYGWPRYALHSGKKAVLPADVWLRGVYLRRDCRIPALGMSIWNHSLVWFRPSDTRFCLTNRLPLTWRHVSTSRASEGMAGCWA